MVVLAEDIHIKSDPRMCLVHHREFKYRHMPCL